MSGQEITAKSHPRLFSWLNAGYAVGVIAALVIAVWLWNYVTTTPTPLSTPRIEASQLSPELNKVYEKFGPFVPLNIDSKASAPDTKAPAVVLLYANGSMDVSREYEVSFSYLCGMPWEPLSGGTGFEAKVTGDYVTLNLGAKKSFVVKVGQTFVYADQPQYMYVVDSDTQLWALTVDDVLKKNLRLHLGTKACAVGLA
ncbi:MAG: hypothetical protein JWL85_56 [Candidatus Saccharibacteria bacterium]|nr:hypothetical protein [Candidatus Saccharibacteria bacterium]